MRCFAWMEGEDGRFKPCPHEAREQLADQRFCGRHAEKLREAVLKESDPLVYFAERDGLIKIGVSGEPVRRCLGMGARLLITERGGRRRETELHRRWVDHVFSGEWFHPAPEILTHIGSLSAATREAAA